MRENLEESLLYPNLMERKKQEMPYCNKRKAIRHPTSIVIKEVRTVLYRRTRGCPIVTKSYSLEILGRALIHPILTLPPKKKKEKRRRSDWQCIKSYCQSNKRTSKVTQPFEVGIALLYLYPTACKFIYRFMYLCILQIKLNTLSHRLVWP